MAETTTDGARLVGLTEGSDDLDGELDIEGKPDGFAVGLKREIVGARIGGDVGDVARERSIWTDEGDDDDDNSILLSPETTPTQQ